MPLIVIIGPPAAGKSTYALAHARPGDIVIDFDRLAVALSGNGGDPHDHPAHLSAVAKAARTAAIDAALKHKGSVDVYLIHSSPGAQRLADYRAMGAQIVTVDPGRDVVRGRCKGGNRPQHMYAVIDEWYREHAETVVPQGIAPSPMYAFPEMTSRDW
jgi:AAA domain